MQSTYWIILFIAALFSSSSLTAAAQIKVSSSHNNNMILLVDELGCESLSDDKICAITLLLNRAIEEQASPIIVSRSILHNYVARKSFPKHPSHPENSLLASGPFHKGIWRIFKIIGSSYYLLLPEAYLTRKKIVLEPNPNRAIISLGLHFHMTIELSHMLPYGGDFYRDLRTFLRDDKGWATLALMDLSQIFITHSKLHGPSPCSWFFYIIGHGSPKSSTAGTSIVAIQNLLAFFDTFLRTNIVYINSCFLGGPVKEMLISKTKPYHFLLTIGSIGDSVVVVHSEEMSFAKFFASLERITVPIQEDELAKACSHLAPCKESKWSSHGVSSLPQVLLKEGFKILDPHGTVAKIEKPAPSPKDIKPKKSYDPEEKDIEETSEKPIHPENTIVIPLYEIEYSMPIHITPAICVKKNPEHRSPLSFVANTEYFLRPESLDNQTTMLEVFGNASTLLDPFINPSLSKEENYRNALKHLSPPMALFPLFVSMIHGECAMHHFANIVVLNEIGDVHSPFFGLLRFLRDAFCDASNRASKKVFLIDKLTGFNDLGLFSKLQENSSGPNPYSLHAPLMADEGEIITLSNVMVITEGRLEPLRNGMRININFVFKGRSWHFNFLDTPEKFNTKRPWLFMPQPMDKYAKHYQRCLLTQASYDFTPKSYSACA